LACARALDIVFLIVLVLLMGFSEEIVLEVEVVDLELVKLFSSSRSGVEKKIEIVAMKMEETMRKSFIYTLEKCYQKIGDEWRRCNYMRIGKDYLKICT
jgi:hypothetical protein